MRGITRSALFRSNSRDRSFGAATATLPVGANPEITPVLVGATVLLHNPKNLTGGSVTPATSMSNNLKANIRTAAGNMARYPIASFSCTAFAETDEDVHVSVVYSKNANFSGTVQEKTIDSPSGSGVVFHLNDLNPSSTYYLKAFARSKITNTPSIWTGSPIIINTYTTIANGAYAGGYYINSQLTTLSLNGTGEWNGSYYINGQITELVYSEDLGWSGLYQDRFYDHGQPSNGFVSGYWWYEGYQTSELFANHGNGMYQGLFFQNYVPYTGYYDGDRKSTRLNSSHSSVSRMPSSA